MRVAALANKDYHMTSMKLANKPMKETHLQDVSSPPAHSLTIQKLYSPQTMPESGRLVHRLIEGFKLFFQSLVNYFMVIKLRFN